MQVRLELVGTSPLLMHNEQLVDPDNEWQRQIAIYAAKRKKTEDDRREMERLEWFGGLYVEDGRVVVPTRNIRKCLINAGKISRQGTQTSRALSFASMNVPLAYEGPEDINVLFGDRTFHNRASVGISNKRVIRVRPQFTKWAIVTDALLLEDVMDLGDLALVSRRAGQSEGLGDNRVNGFGRFNAIVTEVSQ